MILMSLSLHLLSLLRGIAGIPETLSETRDTSETRESPRINGVPLSHRVTLESDECVEIEYY